MGASPRAELLSVTEGNIGAETDHAEARSNALAAAETHAALEFALERSRKDNDKKIGSGIKEYRKSAENYELQEYMAAFRRNELRNEGKEKQSSLWVQDFRENPLTKGARRGGLRCADNHLRISRADYSDAQPDKICGARVSDSVKCYSRSSKDRGDAERGS
jgi:hypothetical protein